MTATPDFPGHRSADPASSDGSGDRTEYHPAAVEVVRSEEQLQVGRAVRISGRAVLRRYVVTETVTETFQVRREEIRLDYEPADSTDSPASGAPVFDGRVVEMVLHREVPVVQLHVQATELVRLHVDTITEHVPVSADLRQERLGVDTAGS